MISDLNLEAKTSELWRGFSPKNEAEFWQAYVVYLAQAQERQIEPTSSTLTNAAVQLPTNTITISKDDNVVAEAHTFSGKMKMFSNVPEEWQVGVGVFILLGFGLSYVLQSGLVVFLVVAFLLLVSVNLTDSGDDPTFKLDSHELIVEIGYHEGKLIKRCFILKDIDQVSAGFNPHYDRYTFNVKMKDSEESFVYKLSITDHQRFYDALRLHKVYVAKWSHPTA